VRVIRGRDAGAGKKGEGKKRREGSPEKGRCLFHSLGGKKKRYNELRKGRGGGRGIFITTEREGGEAKNKGWSRARREGAILFSLLGKKEGKKKEDALFFP